MANSFGVTIARLPGPKWIFYACECAWIVNPNGSLFIMARKAGQKSPYVWETSRELRADTTFLPLCDFTFRTASLYCILWLSDTLASSDNTLIAWTCLSLPSTKTTHVFHDHGPSHWHLTVNISKTQTRTFHITHTAQILEIRLALSVKQLVCCNKSTRSGKRSRGGRPALRLLAVLPLRVR